MDENILIKNAKLKHHLSFQVTDAIKALVRYALHVGFNEGAKTEAQTEAQLFLIPNKFHIQQIAFVDNEFRGFVNLGVHNFSNAVILLKERYSIEVNVVNGKNCFSITDGGQVSFLAKEKLIIVTTIIFN